MDAIVTAGGIPQPGEHLYEHTQGKSKAMLDICGKPMIQWVLDALCGAETVERVLIVGLPPDSGLVCPKLVEYLPNHGGLLQNLLAGMDRMQEINPQAKHFLTVSSDIPAITPEMVDWLVNNTTQKTDLDFYYTVLSRAVMEARYPNSKRSYVRLKDVEMCGGDINVVRAHVGTTKKDLWERIIASRKNALKQASLIGYDTLFLVLFRLITREQAVRIISKRLQITADAVACPYAEVGMDVDKDFQLEIVRADLAKRLAAPA